MKRLDPPRRSSECLPIEPAATTTPTLSFSGRSLDSLYFTVSGSAYQPTAPGGAARISGGFRYDLATDSASLDPGTLPPFSQSTAVPPGLSAYPNFIYFEPGKPLLPTSGFGTAIAMAETLRLDCNFDCALQWCRSIFDPTSRDNTWEQCQKRRDNTARSLLFKNTSEVKTIRDDTHDAATAASESKKDKEHAKDEDRMSSILPQRRPSRPKAQANLSTSTTDGVKPTLTPQTSPEENSEELQLQREFSAVQKRRDGPCCPCGPVSGGVARGRAVLLHYLQILLQWADSLMSRNSMEFFQQALIIFNLMDRILGPPPSNVKAHSVLEPMMVANFVASPAPLLPELLRMYDSVADRRHMVHESINAMRQRNETTITSPHPGALTADTTVSRLGATTRKTCHAGLAVNHTASQFS